MADAEPAFPPPPAPAASALEPAPLAAPAPEPAVDVPAPTVEQEVIFYFCFKSSLTFRFRQLWIRCTFFGFPLPSLSVFTCFDARPFLLLIIFNLGTFMRVFPRRL